MNYLLCDHLLLTNAQENNHAEHGQQCRYDHAEHHSELVSGSVLGPLAALVFTPSGCMFQLRAGAGAQPVM